jgi:tetratricopeptide (TPR) repeat protein
MEVGNLSTSSSSQSLFREYVLSNIEYWRDYVALRATDISLLDRGRNRIVKAIIFALDLEEAWPFIAELIESFSSYMERRGHWETWSWVLTQTIEGASASNDLVNKVSLTALLARLLQRQGRNEEAVTYYRRTIYLARRIGDQFNKARACSNLGYLCIDHGYWGRAEVLCCHALDIFKAIDNDHGRAHTENHLGILFTRQHRWGSAQQHLLQACKIWRSNNDDHGLMRGFINLGNLYHQMGRGDQALIYHKKALYQANLVGEEAETGMILINMAITQKKAGDLASAESLLWQAETIHKRLSNDKGLALTWHNLGWLYVDQHKWQNAKFYLETALTASRNLSDSYIEIETLIGLVKYEIARRDKESALVQLEALDRSINQNPQYTIYRASYTQLVKQCYNLPPMNVQQVVAE